MHFVTTALLTLGLVVASAAHADLTGHWRVGFTNGPGEPVSDYCRFDFVESPPGQIQGHLGLCGFGTDGVFSGTVDGSGAVTLRIVAPDDIGCEVYRIYGTVAPGMDEINGTYVCDYRLAGLGGDVVVTPCDPLTPGSCPETTFAGLPPRLHEVRACAPVPATPCRGSVGALAKLKVSRNDTYHWKFTFALPDAAATTLAQLGDPTTVRDYVACIYQTVAGSPQLIGMEPAWAATSCGTKPCWAPTRTGVKYHNRTGRLGKLVQLSARIRRIGTATVVASGGATTVFAPPPGAPLGLPVTVQVLADDTCFGATFTTTIENSSERLKAKFGQ